VIPGWRPGTLASVPAVLLQDAPEPAHALSQASLEPLVRARWTAPGGTPCEGEVHAPGGARAGTAVMVWTDGSGRLEGAPVQHVDVTIQEAFVGLAAAVLAAAAVVVTGFLARRALDRRRLAARDADWSRAGLQWTGRL
jgi:type IV secretory pathway VirB2 component (pilin)